MNDLLKRLAMVGLLFIVVPIVSIFLLLHAITSGMETDPRNPAMSEDAIAERLKPVGQVSVVGVTEGAPAVDAAGLSQAEGGGDAVAEETVAMAAPAPAAASPADTGQQVYDAACKVCHDAGIAGAPKVGDKAAWEARIAQGIDVLYTSAIKGKNTMPPKGGAMATSDADIKLAVDVMVKLSR